MLVLAETLTSLFVHHGVVPIYLKRRKAVALAARHQRPTGGPDDWTAKTSSPQGSAPAQATTVGVLDPTAHPGLPLEVFLGVGRCCRL